MLSNMILIPQGKLSSLRGRLRPGRAHAPEGSPSLRAGFRLGEHSGSERGLSEPEAGAEPEPAVTPTLPPAYRQAGIEG